MIRRRFWALKPGRDLPISYIAKAAVAKILVKTSLCWLFTTTLEGYRLRFHPSTLSRYYWLYGRVLSMRDTEASRILGTGVVEVVALLRRLLHPGDAVIDVGANVGTLTCQAAARVGPTGKVYAFEPHPIVYRFLLDNLRLNEFRNVQASCVALGDADGEVSFADSISDEAGYVAQGFEGAAGHDPAEVLPARVRMCRLDEVDTGRGDIALLKIDVEGYEGRVLRGARQTLDRCQVIVFEASDELLGRYRWTTSGVIVLLESLGFRVFRPSVLTGALRRVRPDYRPLEGDEHENLIAVKDAQRLARLAGWRVDVNTADDAPRRVQGAGHDA